MATVMIKSSYASDDPTRAALPLHYAVAALDAGHEAEVFLVGEAVYLMKGGVADALQPVGLANVGALLRDAVAKGARFFV